MEVKICKTCQQEFPATFEYFWSQGGKLFPHCKPCARNNKKKYRLETESAKQKIRYASNPMKYRARVKAHYDANKMKERQRRLDYYYNVQKHRDDHLARKRITAHKREALKRSLPATLTPEEWDETLLEFDFKCAYCGTKGFMTQDHVIPVSAGGGYIKENIVPACETCNASKQASPVVEWFKRQEFFSLERLEKIKAFTGLTL